MNVKSGDFVMPGDVIGVSEQFLPDKLAYDDGGYIKAAVLGTVSIDDFAKTISIIPKSGGPNVLEVGDKVYGQITDLRGQRALVHVQSAQKTSRELAFSYMAAIHISQVKKGYLEKITDAFRIGDIIQATVTKVSKDNLDLSTKNPSDGVLKAICTRCRAYMVKTNNPNELYCEICGRKEKRKVSDQYRC
ncbi:MAG: exosome complex RNA-binding protein Csl4 [Methanobrevibacter sp.]|jgi:exosome complex component CSL4|nr:exosome complex RNA-binding protein Csl4 [Candidatus Methanoflexus mossambicus]